MCFNVVEENRADECVSSDQHLQQSVQKNDSMWKAVNITAEDVIAHGQASHENCDDDGMGVRGIPDKEDKVFGPDYLVDQTCQTGEEENKREQRLHQKAREIIAITTSENSVHIVDCPTQDAIAGQRRSSTDRTAAPVRPLMKIVFNGTTGLETKQPLRFQQVHFDEGRWRSIGIVLKIQDHATAGRMETR